MHWPDYHLSATHLCDEIGLALVSSGIDVKPGPAGEYVFGCDRQ